MGNFGETSLSHGCFVPVSLAYLLHDFFRLSASLQASLCCHSAECQCRRCVSDASHIRLFRPRITQSHGWAETSHFLGVVSRLTSV